MIHLPVAPVLAVTIPDGLTFAISAAAVVAGALGVVLSRNPVHSALMLVMTLFGVAVLFVEQDAQFLAAVQVIVYAGAIVVLFLFVIMLLGVDRTENVAAEPLRGQRPFAVLLGLITLGEVLALAHVQWATGARSVAGRARGTGPNVSALARSVFTTYLIPFEITAALLVIAVVGAVILSRRMPRQEDLPPPSGSEPSRPGRPATDEPSSAASPGEPADPELHREGATASAGGEGDRR